MIVSGMAKVKKHTFITELDRNISPEELLKVIKYLSRQGKFQQFEPYSELAGPQHGRSATPKFFTFNHDGKTIQDYVAPVKELFSLLDQDTRTNIVRSLLTSYDTRQGILDKLKLEGCSTKTKEELVEIGISKLDEVIEIPQYAQSIISNNTINEGQFARRHVFDGILLDINMTFHASDKVAFQWWNVYNRHNDFYMEWKGDGPLPSRKKGVAQSSKSVVIDVLKQDEKTSLGLLASFSGHVLDPVSIMPTYRQSSYDDPFSEQVLYQNSMEYLVNREGFQRRQSLFETLRDGMYSRSGLTLTKGTRILISNQKKRVGKPISKKEFDANIMNMKLIGISAVKSLSGARGYGTDQFILSEIIEAKTEETLMASWQTFFEKNIPVFIYKVAQKELVA